MFVVPSPKKGGGGGTLGKKHFNIIEHSNSNITSLSNKQWNNTFDA